MRLSSPITRSLLTIVSLLGLIFNGTANASWPPLRGEDAFQLTATYSGQSFSLEWKIEPGYYLYRDFLTASDADGAPLELSTPKGTVKDDPNFGSTEIYYDKLKLSVSSQQAITVTYQGCQDGGLCYPPMTQTIDPALLNITSFSPAPPTERKGTPIIQVSESTSHSYIQQHLTNGGLLLVVTSFLGLGLLLAFTPCVFPMYPILLGSLAKRGEPLNLRQGFSLSSTYVISMAIAFSLFGVIAAWWGHSFQQMLHSQGATYVIVALFILFALSSFGVFHIQLPSAIATRLAKIKTSGGSFRSSALLGFVSALIVGPCVTAPLAGALLYIAQTGDIVIGAVALFAMGLGKGIPLILLATFGSALLPKAGKWMEHMKVVFGLLFLAAAIYFSATILAPHHQLVAWGTFTILIAVLLATAQISDHPSHMTLRFTKAGAVVVILYGGALFIGGLTGGSDPYNPLAKLTVQPAQQPFAKPSQEMLFRTVNSPKALNTILNDEKDNRPKLIYFTADWCVTCKTIERNVLSQNDVTQVINGFNAVAFDLTDITAEKSALLKELNVFGPPTMLLLDKDSAEIANTRLIGDITKEALFMSSKLAHEASQ